MLEALSANIAVLDGDGVIVWANERWKQFARDNGGAVAQSYVGTNYLAICEAAANGSADSTAQAMLDGLRSVASGALREFVLEYPCHSPQVQRWFLARATRCERQSGVCIVVTHEDITARKLAEIALGHTEQTLRMTLEALPVGVWVMDASGRIVHGNPAGQRIWAGARYVGPGQFGEYKGWWLATGKPIAADEWAAARAINKGETSLNEEIRIQCFDGSSKIILNSAIPLHDAAGTVTGAIIVNQDITARRQAVDELRLAKQTIEQANEELRSALKREQRAARTDELTGAYNRRHFFDVADQLFDVARRYGQPLSVII
ncbi:MAG: PAS domain-containing protein, partial [Gammaproteobacteria bacterium]